MTIPRLAIARPVTMFMLSFVVVLLGAIAFSKRKVASAIASHTPAEPAAA